MSKVSGATAKTKPTVDPAEKKKAEKPKKRNEQSAARSSNPSANAQQCAPKPSGQPQPSSTGSVAPAKRNTQLQGSASGTGILSLPSKPTVSPPKVLIPQGSASGTGVVGLPTKPAGTRSAGSPPVKPGQQAHGAAPGTGRNGAPDAQGSHRPGPNAGTAAGGPPVKPGTQPRGSASGTGIVGVATKPNVPSVKQVTDLAHTMENIDKGVERLEKNAPPRDHEARKLRDDLRDATDLARRQNLSPDQRAAAERELALTRGRAREYVATHLAKAADDQVGKVLEKSLTQNDRARLVAPAVEAQRANEAVSKNHSDETTKRALETQKKYTDALRSSLNPDQRARYDAAERDRQLSQQALQTVKQENSTERAFFQLQDLKKDPTALKGIPPKQIEFTELQYAKTLHDRNTRTLALDVDRRLKAGDTSHLPALNRALDRGATLDQQIANTRGQAEQQIKEMNAVRSERPPRYTYDPKIDPKREPEKALRAELAARLLGGPSNGKSHLSLEQQFGVHTPQLAAALADGNPLSQSVYSDLFGGKDPLTGKQQAPLWKEMGISREKLRETLTERPWEVASRQLGKPLSEESYNKLQQINGPLGHLLNMGADPAKALTLQESWSAHFYGGTDPFTQEQLKPVWERWGSKSPQLLNDVLGTDAAASATLPSLIGGKDPKTGQVKKQPWGDKPELYAADNLRQAKSILGIESAHIPANAVPGDAIEPYALGLTSNAAYQQFQYQNPMGLAQSPHMRNGPEHTIEGDKRKAKLAAASVTDPLGGVGLFGLVNGGKKPPEGAAVGDASGGLSKQPPKYQAHGFYQVYPGGNQENVALVKLQRMPRFDQKQLDAHRKELIKEQTSELLKDVNKPSRFQRWRAERKAERYANGELQKLQESRFVKGMGSWTDAGGNVMVFTGKSDESRDDSRARRPAVLGVDWGRAPDGSLDSLALTGAGQLPGKSSPRWHAVGGQIQIGKDAQGDWQLTGGSPVGEIGKRRWQFYPNLTRDPDSGALSGGVTAGTGRGLIEFGLQNDVGKPREHLNPQPARRNENGLGPHQVYSDPSTSGWNAGFMVGNNGKALGAAADHTRRVETETYAELKPGTNARQAAKDLFTRLGRNGAPELTQLAPGTGISNTESTTDGQRVNAFYSLVNVSGSHGDGVETRTQLSRPTDTTWKLSRVEAGQQEFAAAIGVGGFGPGGSKWDKQQQGETFTLTGTRLPNIKDPLVPATTRAAVNDYLRGGVFPNATQLDSKIPSNQRQQYEKVRNEFVNSRTDLSRAEADQKAKEAAVRQSSDNSQARNQLTDANNRVKDANGRYLKALQNINDVARRAFEPGDKVMPGLTLDSKMTRDTDGSSTSIGPWLVHRRETTRTEVKQQDNVRESTALDRSWMFRPDLKEQLGADKPKVGDEHFTFSTHSEVRLNPIGDAPGERGVPDGLPYNVVKDVDSRGDKTALNAVGAGKNVHVNGTLSVDASAKQLRVLGASMNANKYGKDLWKSFAARTSQMSAMAQGQATQGDFVVKNPEYADNLRPNLVPVLMDETLRSAERNKVALDDKLAKTFANTDSVDKFKKLPPQQQKMFTDLVLASSSADHSPYEALAMMSTRPAPPKGASGLRGDEEFAKGVKDIVKRFDDMNFAAINPKPVDPKQPSRNPQARIYLDATSELVRFLRDQAPSTKTKDELRNQTAFQTALPQAVADQLSKGTDVLAKELTRESVRHEIPPGQRISVREWTQWRAVKEQVTTDDSPGKLAALAMKAGPVKAWSSLADRRIDVKDVFKHLGSSADDHLLRLALVNMLSPGASATQQAFLEQQRRLAAKQLG